MYKWKRILAVIIARGGSKGIKNKNILPLCGNPLITWTIKAAKESRYIDRLIVSTESVPIKTVALREGAEVPFRRPRDLAMDNTPGPDVVKHAIDWCTANGDKFDVVVLLQPTSPLREAMDIDRAIKLLFAKNAKSIVGVCPVPYIPERVNRLPADGCMKDFIQSKHQRHVRQKFEEAYRVNGAVYVAYCEHFLKHKRFLTSGTYAYCMPAERSVDIDTMWDWEIAEFFMTKRLKSTKRYS